MTITYLDPAVRNALRELAVDLRLAKRAGVTSPKDFAPFALRAVDAYDGRLKVAGFEQDGVTKTSDVDLTKRATADQARIAELNERVAELEKMAMPGGPARMAIKRATPTPTRADAYRAQAEQTSDPTLRLGYLQLAHKLDRDQK
jgi:hypothetical protein